ncbi:MAG: SGNH/GDSL hydrolase family protein [Ktedonobacteraceae bacterium]
MLKNAQVYQRIVVPLTFALLLLFISAPAVLAAARNTSLFVGPKQHYLALGDSLAFGYQPDLDFNHGYVDDFFHNLQSHGVKDVANMGCPGETSVTFLNGKCPYPFLRKFPYVGSQLNAALTFLHLYAGQVSPVTLDIGANDITRDINTSNCSINEQQFQLDLATIDKNLTQVILPQLHAALTVNGQVTGDLVMMNYYDPFQNICSDSVSFTETVNAHLAADVSGYGTIVNVFSAFGGPATPNPHICSYTWMCTIFKDIHATDIGYSVIAATFEQGTGY